MSLAAVVLCGCTERSLDGRPADGPLKIDLVWPDGQSVDGARILLYGSDGELLLSSECASGGYQGRVAADTYTVLVVNTDCSNADYEHPESWRECRMAARMDTGEHTLQQVGRVFCIGTTGVTVMRGNQPTEITMYPQNAVRKINFRIDPGYIDDIADMEVRLGGIVPSVNLMDGKDAGETTGDVMAPAHAETGGIYSADMSVFGWRGGNIVTVTVSHSDGSSETTMPQDISSQLAKLPPEGGTVNIVLTLPDGGQIGLTVTVDAWQSGTGSGTVG